jgi:penicillin-binding protein 1A
VDARRPGKPEESSTRHGAVTRSGWRRALWIALGLSVVLVAGFAAYATTVFWRTPTLHQLREVQAAHPSVVLSADGVTLTTFRRERQEPVPLDHISAHVVDALIDTEDHRFFEHHGIDWRRTVAALWHTAQGDTQGGSTLTQQLARNLFPDDIGRARSLHRKLKELFTALRIERVYSKQQIVESYLNTVPFLYNVVGIEMAARTYYGTSAAELDAQQAATLVGMLKGTHQYNPVRFPERAQKRRNLVLSQMVKRGHLSSAQYASLSTQPVQVELNRESEDLGVAPHFAAHARKWLTEWADANDHDLYADGLMIHSTLDTRLQAAATQAAEEHGQALQRVADVEWSAASVPVASSSTAAYAKSARLAQPFAHFWKKQPALLEAAMRETPEFRQRVAAGASPEAALQALAADTAWLAKLKARKTRLETGLVAIDPATGEIKAWVASRDFGADQYDHVAQAQRQPGSTFKPFVYGAALEAGIGPQRTYVDEPVEVPLGNGRYWRPTDMSGFSGATMTLRDGLAYSKNTITAQVMREVGVSRVASLAQAMGVNLSKLDPVPSLALGTSPVTLLEMVSSYATIARQGQHQPPIFVTRIDDRNGHALASFGGAGRRAMSAEGAIELTDMMRGVITRGTGTLVRTRFGLTGDLAGKTGTTQNNTDGWFILMHPRLVAGAWVGFNDSRVTMRSNHWGQGGHNAILVVGDFFREVVKLGAVDAKAVFPPSRYPPQVIEPKIDPGAEDENGAQEAPMQNGELDANAQGSEGGVDAVKATGDTDRLLDRLAGPREAGGERAGGDRAVTGAPVPLAEGGFAAPLRIKAEAVSPAR